MPVKTLVEASKCVAFAIAVSGVVALPAQAQQVQPASHSGVTRAQVRKELADLESVGCDTTADDNHYPRDLQAAEKRLAQKNAAQRMVLASVAATN
ncbi:DUF4148 domain-containing protein [Caballeronia sordidicola]|uniref:Purine nucleoside phosphorylase n=1 Tax=Caballeronia sordidicola TaxID=196367 RepID=A0A242MYD6_CABSO|nr:DUF4148 domain-containing protein [Caballeronia sordidicola]OTP76144.1 hypothetical protein PAMC26510_11950 [Caballeronia sordidicola]